MLCDNCGENESKVRYTQIVNGIRKEMNLCQECSKKINLNYTTFDMPFSFSNFFSNFLAEYDNQDLLPIVKKEKKIKCDKCNMTYSEFLEGGKLGCANCYNVFADQIDYILEKLCGNDSYKKKKNVKENVNTDLENLKIKLEKVIKEEKYEDAAIIRDEIKKLQDKEN